MGWDAKNWQFQAEGLSLHWQGWLASSALHTAVAALLLIAPFGTDFEATDLFQWDVILVEQKVPEASTVDAGDGGERPSAARKRQVQEESPHSVTPVVQRIQTRMVEPTEMLRRNNRQVQERAVLHRGLVSAHEVERPLEKEESITPPVQPPVTEKEVRAPSAVVSSAGRSIERLDEVRLQEVERSNVPARHDIEEHLRVSDTVSSVTRAVVRPRAVHQAAVSRRNVIDRSPARRSSRAWVSTDSPDQGAGAGAHDSSQEAAVGNSDIGHGLVGAPAGSRSGEIPEASDPAGADEDAREATPGVWASETSEPGRESGPDYGWLKKLLWERINRVKSYSDEAIDNEWEGRVMMVVTIRADGRIADVRVVESSGNSSLDREAAALVERASPLHLDRAIGAARVRLRVPIAFGLQ